MNLRNQFDKEDRIKIDVVLNEYRELRTESRESAQIQITIVGMILTAFGVLGGLGVSIANNANPNTGLLGCIFFIIIPSIVSFG